MANVKIKENKIWYWEEVMNLCIKENWYTHGNNEQYSKMLDFVKKNKPTKTNIYKVALDILEHIDKKEEQTVTNIMYYLSRNVVITTYEVEKEG